MTDPSHPPEGQPPFDNTDRGKKLKHPISEQKETNEKIAKKEIDATGGGQVTAEENESGKK